MFYLQRSRFIPSISLIVLTSLLSLSCATAPESSTEAQEKKPHSSPSVISASDTPTGFAGIGWESKARQVVEVRNAEELKKYASAGGYVVYVSGEIAITDKLPPSATGENAALNALIAEKSEGKIQSWNEWKKLYALENTVTSEKKSNSDELNAVHSALVKAWKDEITVKVASDTVIIGLGGAVIKGGSLSVQGVANVAIRNVTIQDAFDPFPHHEANDGWNAEYDCISIVGSRNIWIDHCTIQDTISVGEEAFDHVREGDNSVEKWQTYDGLCDMKGSFANVTVSSCHFKNHDKTMLVGSSDSEKFEGVRTLTLSGNYFENCVQRLPMVRLTNVHIYNNYYDAAADSAYKSSYCIGARNESRITAENNCFGSGIKNTVSGHASKQGSLYLSRNIDNSSKGAKEGQFIPLSSPAFDVPYQYNPIASENVADFCKQSAGSDVLSVAR